MKMKLLEDNIVWENFVFSHAPRSLFQSWFWGEVQKKLGATVWRMGFYDNDTLIGIAQIIKVIARRGTFLHVRHGPIFIQQKKKYWQEKECVNDKIFCMKGTSEEMTYVPESQLKKQKGKMLVVTKGKEGVEAYYKGKNYEFRPRHVIRSKYAIGAGDTFFANFVSRFVKTGDFSGSIEHAMDKTSELLESLKFNLDFA